MPEIKNTFLKSKMNKDLDSRIIGNGEYRDAQNASVSASEDASVGSLENIRGNKILSSFGITDVNIEVIGQYSDTANNRMFFFLTDYTDSSINTLNNFSEGDNIIATPSGSISKAINYGFKKDGAKHYICCAQLPNTTNSSIINLNTIGNTILVSGSFLNFSKTHPINGINVIENLLFWTDNRNQPRKININTALSQNFVSAQQPGYYANEDDISVAKYSPYSSISFVKNFITGDYESTLLNQNEEWLPPFFANPGVVKTATPPTDPNILQFDNRAASTNRAYSQLATFLGNDSDAIWKGNNYKNLKVQLANDASSSYAYIESIDETNNSIVLKNFFGNTITNIETELGWVIDGAFVFEFSLKNPYYDPNFSGDAGLLEDSFTRFSYRFKYDDNEYSLTAPFSQHAFVPKQFGYFLTGDTDRVKDSSIVSFMENQITTIDLVLDLPYAPNELQSKLNVKEIQLLYKSSDDQNVKIIQDIDITDPDLQLGCPKTVSINNLGNGYPSGEYRKVPLDYFVPQGGTSNPNNKGIGLKADISVNASNIITSVTINSNSLIQKSLSELDYETSIILATPGEYNFIQFTSSSTPSNETAAFQVTIDSLGQVSNVKVIAGGGGYAIDDILTFDTTVLGGQGILKVTVDAGMLGGDVSGQNYKIGDLLSIPPLGANSLGANGTIKIESLSNSYLYRYSSEKPIKILTDKEVTRVSDIVPMRAQTQEAIGNRIVYGNFLQNKSTPSLNYSLDIKSKGLGQSTTDVEYNNSTLKQGRSYQVGIVLQDRYGRASNVIINNDSALNSSLLSQYTNGGTNPLGWPGNSLSVNFNDTITPQFSSDQNGLYNENNPLGWYSYKIVVQQQQQEYYNIYVPGALSGNIIYTKNDTPLEYGATNEIFQIPLFNDNINKIPRELVEVGATDSIFSSNVVLYNRVKNTEYNQDPGTGNWPNLSNQNPLSLVLKQEVNTVRPFKELGEWTAYKNIDLHYLNMDPETGGSQYDVDTFIYPGEKGEIDPFYLQNNNNPYIATISTKSRIGFLGEIQGETPTDDDYKFAKSLTVFETKPFKSNLDIYYETSTSGLISDLNFAIENDLDPTGEGVLSGIDNVVAINWSESTLEGTIITNEFTANNPNGTAISGPNSQILEMEIISVTNANNVLVTGNPPFELVPVNPPISPSIPPTFALKLKKEGEKPYLENSATEASFSVKLRASAGTQFVEKIVDLRLTNVAPQIYRMQEWGNQTESSYTKNEGPDSGLKDNPWRAPFQTLVRNIGYGDDGFPLLRNQNDPFNRFWESDTIQATHQNSIRSQFQGVNDNGNDTCYRNYYTSESNFVWAVNGFAYFGSFFLSAGVRDRDTVSGWANNLNAKPGEQQESRAYPICYLSHATNGFRDISVPADVSSCTNSDSIGNWQNDLWWNNTTSGDLPPVTASGIEKGAFFSQDSIKDFEMVVISARKYKAQGQSHPNGISVAPPLDLTLSNFNHESIEPGGDNKGEEVGPFLSTNTSVRNTDDNGNDFVSWFKFENRTLETVAVNESNTNNPGFSVPPAVDQNRLGGTGNSKNAIRTTSKAQVLCFERKDSARYGPVSINTTAQELASLDYISSNGQNNSPWNGALYFIIECQLQDANGNTGTLPSESYFVNFVITGGTPG